ncbi:MAG TPA: nuclear transport factor 2 family protein [Thermomonospora sp.]|nr:nuclear transport factor 2 family protein [Thermomonospora sp.]
MPPTADTGLRLADRADLIDLVSRYHHSLDARRFDDAWARSLFTEDVVLDFPVGGHEGVAGLAEFTTRFMGRWDRTHHHATDHLVTLDGDHATVVWNMLATHVHPAGSGAPGHFHLGARLDGATVRGPGGWRFRRLALRVIWTSGRPAAGVPVPASHTTSQED